MSWHLKMLGPNEKRMIDQFVRASTSAAAFYNELAPDGRRLSKGEAEKAREQLVTLTICLRQTRLNRFREHELRGTISLARMIQRGLGLALSEEAHQRRRAMPLEEMAGFAAPVHRFFRDL
jgi:hypothetical protein